MQLDVARRRPHRRWYSDVETENINVAHSRFLAESPPGQKWNGKENMEGRSSARSEERELENLPEGKGKLSSTSSHLFKLILPLGRFQKTDNDAAPPPPTVFLLHPSQPLSHVNRLIASALTPFPSGAPPPTVSFRGKSEGGSAFQWADSTDIAHFVRDAGRASEFTIAISPPPAMSDPPPSSSQTKSNDTSSSSSPSSSKSASSATPTISIPVLVPTFADRTRFLHLRLRAIDAQLAQMDRTKRLCDREAHRGARRVALSGFGVLVVYWTAVARLTFWDYGWDVMEPITYLSGLTTVICGYLWFLYQGREVSYTSLLDRSISSRREQQYKAHGLDIDRWAELVEERKWLRKEVARIEADYGPDSGSDGGKGIEKKKKKETKDGQDEREAGEVEEEKGTEERKNGGEDEGDSKARPKSDEERAVMGKD